MTKNQLEEALKTGKGMGDIANCVLAAMTEVKEIEVSEGTVCEECGSDDVVYKQMPMSH